MYSDGTQTTQIKRSTASCFLSLASLFSLPEFLLLLQADQIKELKKLRSVPAGYLSRENLKILDVRSWSSCVPSGSCPREEDWPHCTYSFQNPSSKPLVCIRVCRADRSMVKDREEKTQLWTCAFRHKFSSPCSQLDRRKWNRHLVGAI